MAGDAGLVQRASFAMVGKSYPGITQLFVAAEQPDAPEGDRARPRLRRPLPRRPLARAASSTPRSRPAGRRSASRRATLNPPQWSLETGDQQCLAEPGRATRPTPAFNPLVQGSQPQNHFDGEFYRERSPFWFADQINGPDLPRAVVAGRAGRLARHHLIERLRPRPRGSSLATNGDHGEYYGDEVFPHILRFLQLPPEAGSAARRREYLRSARTASSSTGRTAPSGGRNANWTETYPTGRSPGSRRGGLQLGADGALAEACRLPRQGRLHLRARGRARRSAAASRSPTSRPRRGPTAARRHCRVTSPRAPLDERQGARSARPALDLLVSSTAPDTDFEVTLSEVRPDGKEIFVQQGWLRASHRKELPALSTELRPFQTHQVLDMQPLVPAQADADAARDLPVRPRVPRRVAAARHGRRAAPAPRPVGLRRPARCRPSTPSTPARAHRRSCCRSSTARSPARHCRPAP